MTYGKYRMKLATVGYGTLPVQKNNYFLSQREWFRSGSESVTSLSVSQTYHPSDLKTVSICLDGEIWAGCDVWDGGKPHPKLKEIKTFGMTPS